MYHGSPSKIIEEYKPKRSGNQKLSRYGKLNVLVNENNQRYLKSPKKRVFRKSRRDKIYVVEPDFEDRIDMVSFKFYNTPHLWWVIAEMNGIRNPMRLEVGVVLRIPQLEDILL